MPYTKFTVPSMGSTTQRTPPPAATAGPPPSSPRIGSPGRNASSRSRSSRSVSVSAMVTGSVGVLLD